MNYSHIELILAIADAGSISQAADNLFVSQPFLSSALKRAEDEIGTPLFKRSKSGVTLTPFGHEYVQYARNIADQIETLNSLYNSKQVPQFRLDVASMGFCFLYPMVAEIRKKFQKYPCSFQLYEASTHEQIQLISAGSYEIGLVVLDDKSKKQMLRSIKAKGLEYYRLQDVQTGIYVARNCKTVPSSVKELDENSIQYLVGMPYIGLHVEPRDMHVYEYWSALDSLIKAQDQRYIVSSSGMRSEMINQYNGFGTAGYCSALYEKYPFTEPLRFIPLAPSVNFGYELGWIQRQNQQRSPLANELFQMVSE